MSKPYKYHLRSAHGSKEILIQFFLDDTDKSFIEDLFETLKNINPKTDSIEDLWMNDEVIFRIKSDKGEFLISKDIWDFAFITAEKDQQCILIIGDILNNSSLFKKEDVDFQESEKQT